MADFCDVWAIHWGRACSHITGDSEESVHAAVARRRHHLWPGGEVPCVQAAKEGQAAWADVCLVGTSAARRLPFYAHLASFCSLHARWSAFEHHALRRLKLQKGA